MISDRDFKFITAYETVVAENRNEFLGRNAMQTAETFLSLLSSLSKDQTIQYVLCLMDEMFLEDKTRVDLFHEYCAERKDSLWRQLFSQLHRDDPFIQHMVILFLSNSFVLFWAKNEEKKLNDTSMVFNRWSKVFLFLFTHTHAA